MVEQCRREVVLSNYQIVHTCTRAQVACTVCLSFVHVLLQFMRRYTRKYKRAFIYHPRVVNMSVMLRMLCAHRINTGTPHAPRFTRRNTSALKHVWSLIFVMLFARDTREYVRAALIRLRSDDPRDGPRECSQATDAVGTISCTSVRPSRPCGCVVLLLTV